MRNTDVLAFPPVALQRPESPTTAHEQTQVQNKTRVGDAGLSTCWLTCLPLKPKPQLYNRGLSDGRFAGP